MKIINALKQYNAKNGELKRLNELVANNKLIDKKVIKQSQKVDKIIFKQMLKINKINIQM